MARVVTSNGCVIEEPEVLDGLGVNWEGYEAPLSTGRAGIAVKMRSAFSGMLEDTLRNKKGAETRMDELVAVKKSVSDLRTAAAALSKHESDGLLSADVVPMLRRVAAIDLDLDAKIEQCRRERDEADETIATYGKMIAFFEADAEFDKVLHGLHSVLPKYKNKVYREARRMLSEVAGLQREVLFILDTGKCQVPNLRQFVKTCGEMYATIGEGFKLAKRRIAKVGNAFWESDFPEIPQPVANVVAKICA